MSKTTKFGIADLLLSGCKIAIVCSAMLAMTVPANAAVTTPTPGLIPAPKTAIHRAVATGIKNPHLKGVEAKVGKLKTAIKKKATGEVAHTAWHRRWDYHTWIALHRGLGTISGTVLVPGAQGFTVAKVWLKHPNGAGFALVSRKHITYTDAAGNFTMFGVRTGSYRVVAQIGKKRGHKITAVHPGTMAVVAVKV